MLKDCFPGFPGIDMCDLFSLLYMAPSFHITPAIITLFSEFANWFSITPIGQKWGQQSRCVCNKEGNYNLHRIDPQVPNEKKLLSQYEEYTKLELAKEWHHKSMFTRNIHTFQLDTYLPVS